MLQKSAAATTRMDAAAPRRSRVGLAQRVLLLIAGFVAIAVVAVYVPAIADYRITWLRDRLSAARTAALVLEAAPPDMVPESLRQELLESAGARIIVMKYKGARRLLAMSDMPPQVSETFDLRDPSLWDSTTAAFRTLAAPPGRMVSVLGVPPMGKDFLEITLDETPLRAAMRAYSLRIVLASLAISACVAALALLALNVMVLRPVRRLTSSIMDFGADPQDVSRIITPSGETHELGRAEEALAVMQRALNRDLAQAKHLAALGLAVAKINHDLRNMLASAQLISDRLAELTDPLARRLAPMLVATLDRAIGFCQSVLVYGRADEPAPRLRRIALAPLVEQAVETAAQAPGAEHVFATSIPADLAITADGDQIFRVLLNLCRNALDAVLAPDRAGEPRVEIAARRDAGMVVIEVADNGPGVPPRARERLFEAFQGSTRPGGSGLGLAIAADLTRAHGGALALLDTPAGATFRVTLPDRAPA